MTRFNNAYDSLYLLKKAITESRSTNADKLVSALENMRYTGTWGTIRFQGKDARFAHGLVYGKRGIRSGA